MAESAANIALSSVELDDRTIAELCRQSAYGARVLTALRDLLEEETRGRSRISVAEVLTIVNNEVRIHERNATREAWVRSADPTTTRAEFDAD
jgi:hypothetical protein